MTSRRAAFHGHAGAGSDVMPWIRRFASLVPPGARVLDVASGPGRHARFFAARGCPTIAVDREALALASLADVEHVTTVQADLERDPWPLTGRRFDAVIVTNYLHRALLPFLLDAIAADGVLLYATFATGNGVYGKPSNPDFLLQPGELLTLIADRLVVVAFEQGDVAGGTPAVVQRVAAVGRDRAWPPSLPSA